MSFLVRAIGFFNDAYDLFVMSIVNVVLQEQYGDDVYTPGLKSAVSTGVFVGSVLGQLVFGYYADQLGRKRIMIYTASLLIFGGLASTFVYGGTPTRTLWLLAIARAILGFGIGGEYPLSCTSTAEGASTSDRGQAVSLTFSMQGVGQVAAALAGNLLVQTLANRPMMMMMISDDDNGIDSRSSSFQPRYDPQSLEIIWRTLFGLGVLPALFVLYPRLQAEESTQFQKHLAAANLNSPSHDETLTQDQSCSSRAKKSKSLNWYTAFPTLSHRLAFIWRHYRHRLFGTAGTWFLFDIVFYAQSIFSASVFSSLNLESSSSDDASSNNDLSLVTLKSVYLALGALPGYYLAVYTIDRIGRRNMQLQGFVMMTLLFGIMAAGWEDIRKNGPVFVLLYALTFFFANFGPNTTTFLLPVEAFPTPLRATCHGFSAALGKVGAVLGAAAFDPLDELVGTRCVFLLCAIVCACGIPLTCLYVHDRVGDLDLLDQELDMLLLQEEEEERGETSEDKKNEMSKKNPAASHVMLSHQKSSLQATMMMDDKDERHDDDDAMMPHYTAC